MTEPSTEPQITPDRAADHSQAVAERLEEIHPADGAEVMRALPQDQAADVAEYLDPHTAADVLAAMDPILAASVIVDMELPEAAMVLEAMNPDDRVDVMAHLPRALREQLISEMDASDAAEVRQLEQYPPDTAGGIMTTQVTALFEYLTVDNAITLLRRLNEEFEQIYYVYVIDRRHHLVGVLSMRDLILAKPDTALRDIMKGDILSVPVTMDQEEVARVMRRHGYLALPVVDQRNRLVGLITADDIGDVAEEEATEDMHKLGGMEALDEPYTSVSIWTMFRKRGVWLSVLFVGQMFTATVIEGFEERLAQALLLMAFVPLIISSGGNSGSQATSLIIRAMALGEVRLADWWRVMRREAVCALLLGLWLGILGILRVAFWHWFGWTDYTAFYIFVGFTVGTALVGVVLWGSLVGSMLPFVLRRIGLDPATSSAPFVATLVDVTGLIIYFTAAVFILRGTLL
jgi:magnesium transporter